MCTIKNRMSDYTSEDFFAQYEMFVKPELQKANRILNKVLCVHQEFASRLFNKLDHSSRSQEYLNTFILEVMNLTQRFSAQSEFLIHQHLDQIKKTLISTLSQNHSKQSLIHFYEEILSYASSIIEDYQNRDEAYLVNSYLRYDQCQTSIELVKFQAD
jgi:hypothetical protein